MSPHVRRVPPTAAALLVGAALLGNAPAPAPSPTPDLQPQAAAAEAAPARPAPKSKIVAELDGWARRIAAEAQSASTLAETRCLPGGTRFVDGWALRFEPALDWPACAR